MLTPLPPAALPPPLPSRIRSPSPSPAHHPRTGLDTRGGEGGRREEEEGKGGVEGKRVLIPVAITHRRRLVAFNKNVNMAA